MTVALISTSRSTVFHASKFDTPSGEIRQGADGGFNLQLHAGDVRDNPLDQDVSDKRVVVIVWMRLHGSSLVAFVSSGGTTCMIDLDNARIGDVGFQSKAHAISKLENKLAHRDEHGSDSSAGRYARFDGQA